MWAWWIGLSVLKVWWWGVGGGVALLGGGLGRRGGVGGLVDGEDVLHVGRGGDAAWSEF